jgi:CRP-like cAMP-binding protein
MTKPLNMLLAALPARTYLQLADDLVPVELEFGAVLSEPDQPISDVYFPTECLVSLLTRVQGHGVLEVGMVGREGMLGIPLALGVDISPMQALVQGAGPALRMKKGRFLKALHDSVPLQRGVFGYTHALMMQITQTAVCNRFHVVEARLARWLLMTRDRVGAARFRMTQEFLASMLGVRREGVTEAASVFQRAQLIEYSRGNIHILDHAGLEAAACTCYRTGLAAPRAITPWRPARTRAAAPARK